MRYFDVIIVLRIFHIFAFTVYEINILYSNEINMLDVKADKDEVWEILWKNRKDTRLIYRVKINRSDVSINFITLYNDSWFLTSNSAKDIKYEMTNYWNSQLKIPVKSYNINLRL